MKGKDTFTKAEVEAIKKLIKEKLDAGDKQKGIRAKIRRKGFYWEEYHPIAEVPKVEYNVENFEKLIADGIITITV